LSFLPIRAAVSAKTTCYNSSLFLCFLRAEFFCWIPGNSDQGFGDSSFDCGNLRTNSYPNSCGPLEDRLGNSASNASSLLTFFASIFDQYQRRIFEIFDVVFCVSSLTFSSRNLKVFWCFRIFF